MTVVVGIPPGKDGAKDAARSEAIRRWPDKASLFARKSDDGRAEAALIAVAGLTNEIPLSALRKPAGDDARGNTLRGSLNERTL